MKAMTLDQMFESLIEQLNRLPVEERERERQLFREAFERMATEPPVHVRKYTFPLTEKAQQLMKRLAEPEPEPLPPLSPGRARIVSF